MRHRAIKPAAGVALLVCGLISVWASGAGRASASSVATPGRAVAAAGSAPIALVPNGGVPGHGALVPISTATNTAGTPIKVGESPYGVVLTPGGGTAYVLANTGAYPNQGSLTPVNTVTHTAGKPILAGVYPWGIAVTPDGKTAYVLGARSNTHGFFAEVIPISTATSTAGKPIKTTGTGAAAGKAIPVGPNPTDIAITPGSRS